MFDILIQIGASKLVISALLAGLAWVVQRRVAHPAIAYSLWLLVLVTLLIPAVVSIPVLPGQTSAATVTGDGAALAGEPKALSPVERPAHELAAPGTSLGTWIAGYGKAGFALAWLVGTVLLLGWTLARVWRFRRWLIRTSRPAPPPLLRQVAEIGGRLGLSRLPEGHTTTARVSPMVCWTGGRIHLVIPSFLVVGLDRQELRSVLAHELAHVRRRDHVVRWIEWLACAAFWWNPMAWWARRELRAAEEASCDALGVTALGATPRAFATSLLRAVELMSTPPARPTPAFATGAASPRDPAALERRLRVLLQRESTGRAPRWIRTAGAAATVCLLPLGLVYCGTADLSTPTLPEGSPMPPPVAQSEVVVVLPASRAAELKELFGGDPVYTYWIFDRVDGNVGPHALADAPVQPPACLLDPDEPDEDTRDAAMAACARAMSNDLGGTADSVDRNVCVGWGSAAGGWRGICEGWEPDERHRLHGNSSGSVLLERIRQAQPTGEHRITVFGSER
ncbi:MAG: M56 family metallopeptidase [Gemmatimonadetes bacterium]|nr:M56 family metallopeptidase [Gemmatimonadota bacterium]